MSDLESLFETCSLDVRIVFRAGPPATGKGGSGSDLGERINNQVPSQANWDENHGLRQIQPSLVGAKQAGGRKSC